MVNSENKVTGKSEAIIELLMKPYLGKNHTLFVDNFYSSSALFDLLYNNCTHACGRVRKGRKEMPKIDDKLRKREASFRSVKNLLVIK